MNPKQSIPLMFTIGALLAGFASMVMSAAGEFIQAAQFIMLSMILDGLDGTIARRLKATSTFGAEFDTFVDFSSFGLAPAMLAYQTVFHRFGIWGFFIVSPILICGASRLARFRMVDPFRGQKGYLGLPITTAAGWIALFVFVASTGVLDEEWFSLSSGPVAAFGWGAALVMCGLEISRVHYGKPTKDPVAQIVSVVLVTLLFFDARAAVPAAITLLGFGFMYAFISPLRHRREIDVPDEEEEEEPVSVHH